jgi:esterase/lipase
MYKQKVVFIIPGFRQVSTHKPYKALFHILKYAGYTPIVITIPWKNATISKNTAYFLKEYKKIHAKKKYILGFSFGAMIAFIASTKVHVSGLILCSLSPYFKEDVSKTKNYAKLSISTYQYQDFLQLHCASLVKKIRAKKILMLYGTLEAKSLVKRVKKTFNQIPLKNKFLIPIKKTEHNIGDNRYLYAIHQIAKDLH